MLQSDVSGDESEYEDSESGSTLSSGLETSTEEEEEEEEVPKSRHVQHGITNLEPQKGRPRPVYIDSYRESLNATIEDTTAKASYSDDAPLRPNYIGASFWTREEKELFFNALARYGKDNISAIATSISTKTEVEVRAYSLLLQQGMLEKCLNEQRQQMLGIADLPAALEISQNCCEALERVADGLEAHQQIHEAKIEEQKWDGLWLLTTEVALWAEERMDYGEDGCVEVTEALPEAELLVLKNWIELSGRIFMNPAPPREQENWRFLTAGTDETPSIRYTAFVDFHTLTVSITRRLVQATIFLAMSRLRCMDSKVFSISPLVRARDVRAAAEILGMKLDSSDFWRDAARRCGLHMYKRISESNSKTKMGQRMSYAEVERVLDRTRKGYASHEHAGGEPPAVAAIGEENDGDRSDESISEDSLDSDNDWETADTSTHDESESEARSRSKAKSISKLEKEQNIYAELLDQRAGIEEEKHLWEILGQSQRAQTYGHGEVELLNKPETHRKRKADLVDWRDYVNYRAEWETMETPVPSKMFSKNAMLRSERRKRVKRVQRARITDVEENQTSSDSAESSNSEGAYEDTASPTLSA